MMRYTTHETTLTNFHPRRPLLSYGKIQRLVASIIRTRRVFVPATASQRDYLDIGCGPNTSDQFVNLDYTWSPGIDVCWDITRAPLPFADQQFRGVFSEHCLEHIEFDAFLAVVREVYRVLKPGGVFRLVMPDGELYLDIYQERKTGGTRLMPYEPAYISPMHRINGIFRGHGHRFIYDFATVQLVLAEAGFTNIIRESVGHGRMPMLLRDTASRAIESLYVEAERP